MPPHRPRCGRKAQLKADSAGGAPAINATPEGQATTERNALVAGQSAVQKALAADIALHGENSDAVKRDRAALAEYTDAVTGYLSPAEKEHAITVLQTKALAAKTAAQKADIAEQIEAIKLAGTVASQSDKETKITDAGALAGAKQDAKKGPKGPSDVSEWEEQLRAKEVLSKDFFKDETADELAFWQSKVALTTAGSKDWLAVQGKIYEASKTLAHQAYEDQIASLDDQIEAAKNDWTTEQALWQQKLAFIKTTYGEQSKEYLAAHKAEEAEERRHQAEMLNIARDNEREALSELKANLASQAAVRKSMEQVDETKVQDANEGRPDGAIRAAQQIAALHKQLAQQEIADAQSVYQAEAEIAQLQIELAARTDGTESKAYADAINAKKALDNNYANAYTQKQAQMVATTVADQAKIKAAWHSTIDPLVQSWGSATEGLINGTESWGQALASIGTTIENTIITAIEGMIEKWIVNQIVGETSAATGGAAMVLSNAAVSASAAYASTAAIPVIGPELAPEAAAVAYGATAAFAPLASLAVGTNYVPTDMVAQIHEGERIIPAADNARLMQAMDTLTGRGGAAGAPTSGASSPPGSNADSPVHLHLHGIVDGDSVKKFFMRNSSHVAQSLKAAVRGNAALAPA